MIAEPKATSHGLGVSTTFGGAFTFRSAASAGVAHSADAAASDSKIFFMFSPFSFRAPQGAMQRLATSPTRHSQASFIAGTLHRPRKNRQGQRLGTCRFFRRNPHSATETWGMLQLRHTFPSIGYAKNT